MGRKINKPSIFQGKIEFAPARSNFQIAAQHPYENTMFRALFGIILALVIAYIYFVGSSVLNIIARKDALAQSSRLATIIGVFEKEYFAVSNGITPDAGADLGLSPVSSTAYVYRPGTVGRAEKLNNEI